MQVRDLVQLAAFVAAQGSILLRATRQISTEAMSQYWVASKCRLDRWGRVLREYRAGKLAAGDDLQPNRTAGLPATCAEILASEMLTRIWSCVALSIGAQQSGGETRAIVGSVLSGHIEASNRVLAMLSLSEHLGQFPAADLNRLRRVAEHWTDLLLGRLGQEFNFAEVAHDPARAQDFADDFDVPSTAAARMTASSLLSASLQAAFAPKLRFTTDNADLNERISAAILACFPADLFDSLGVYHSLWLTRLSNVANDAQLVVDQFLAEDAGGLPADSSNGPRCIGRMNRIIKQPPSSY